MTEQGHTRAEVEAWYFRQIELRDGNPNTVLQNYEQNLFALLHRFDDYLIDEDPDLIVLNKPPNTVTTFPRLNPEFSIEDIVRYVRSEKVRRAHRLDRDTTGVLVFAKSPRAIRGLGAQFANKDGEGMQKVYLAILDGEVKYQTDERVDLPIFETPDGTMIVSPLGRASTTILRPPLAVLQDTDGEYKTYTEIQIVTGRTHQIRVVSQYLGHPVTGDRKYNRYSFGAPRQMLHAFSLSLMHPANNKPRLYKSPVPKDMTDVLGRMDWLY